MADGQVLPLDAEQQLTAASGRLDTIAGYTRDEMAAFPGLAEQPEAPAWGEAVFGAPARQWAAKATRQGRRAWSYRFDYGPSMPFGACHCMELPFVFGTLAAFFGAPMMQGARPQDAERLRDRMQQAWISFIRDGDPGWAPWPAYTVFS